MSFFRKFSISIALLMAFSSYAEAAKASSGKVVGNLGDATIQKASKIGEWKQINFGNRVREKDQIRTGIESYVTIALSDGSSITVQENSLVEITTLQAEDGIQTALTDVKTGKVRFDAQKQHSNGSFKFKTATATAAIRGTDGVFGNTIKSRTTILSLFSGNGLFKVNSSGKECNVNGGQTAFMKGDNCQTIDAKTSGMDEFVQALDSLLANDTLSEEQLNKAIQHLDTTLQKQIQEAKKALTCNFEALEDTITVNSLTLKGSCNDGIKLSISGATIENTTNGFEYQTSWASSAEGPKKFNATCTGSLELPCKSSKKSKKIQTCKKEITIDCGTLTTYYKPPQDTVAPQDSTAQDTAKTDSVVAKPFAVTTPSPVNVCDPGAVTIEGTFDQTDPQGILTVTVGNKKSPNLVPRSANGEFSYTTSISDQAGNWNEKKAVVEYSGKSGNHKASVDLDISKSCKQVNMNRPVLNFVSANANKCTALFTLAEANDDIVLVENTLDGTTVNEKTYRQDSKIEISLESGIHEYSLKAKDQADNTTTLTKKLACYPNKKPRIEFTGKDTETLNPPPPPPNSQNTILKSLRFRITEVDKQDPAQVKRIKVTQDGKSLLDLSTNQIDDLNFSIQITLSRSSTSVVKVYVEMMNGMKITKTKTYKVNQ